MGKQTAMQSISDKYSKIPNKSLIFASDFPQYNIEYIGDILSDYVKEGKLIRLANGVYLKTVITQFGPLYPSPTEVAMEIARRDHATVLMSGKAAENYFGLSTQIPMKTVFITNGSARKLKVGNDIIEFKRCVPRNFAFKDPTMATLCLALKSIGKEHVTPEQENTLKNILKKYTEEHDIKEDLSLMPLWIRTLINKLLKQIKK